MIQCSQCGSVSQWMCCSAPNNWLVDAWPHKRVLDSPIGYIRIRSCNGTFVEAPSTQLCWGQRGCVVEPGLNHWLTDRQGKQVFYTCASSSLRGLHVELRTSATANTYSLRRGGGDVRLDRHKQARRCLSMLHHLHTGKSKSTTMGLLNRFPPM